MLLKRYMAVMMALLMVAPPASFAANHREAPITSIDRTADITDWFAFVSYDDPTKITMILCVDPLLEPANGPNYFPFDDNIVYTMKVDNNYDAVEDVTFEFRFKTEIRAPGVPLGFIGAGAGIARPANAPLALAGSAALSALVVPPAITALDGKGSEGFNLRQSYSITLITNDAEGKPVRTDLTGDKKLFAVPSNAGPRTMPDYTTLAKSGIYSLDKGVRVFAGTTDDPFYIDLGGAFDSLNLRNGASFLGIPGALSALQDQNDSQNYAADTVSGYNVNTIAIEVPISTVAQAGKPAIGAWGATYRAKTTIRRAPDPFSTEGDIQQVQRMGNPLINELVIGTGAKDKFSMSQPKDDKDFADFALDPVLARVLNGLGIAVPNAPRNDLLFLVQYTALHAPAGTATAGPVADLLRINTSVKPTAKADRKRIGVLAGDNAGFPNGRRVSDDVTDVALRAVAGVLVGAPFNVSPNNLLGDGVNTNDLPYQETFPYVPFSQDGRNRRHIDPGESGCAQGGGICPIN
ncbi:MAG: DUF4331 domain-containing protein [Bryobacteraceae bacterium]